MLIVALILLAFLISTYFITEHERRQHSMREAENVLMTLSSNISSNLRSYAELSRIVMTDERLAPFLKSDASLVDFGMINDARYAVMDILNVTEGVDSVMIFRNDLIMFSTNRFYYKFDLERMNGTEWKEDILEAKGGAVVSLNSNGVANRPDEKPVVTIGRAIYDLYTQKRTGILFMNIATSVFERILWSMHADNICILGEDATYLAGTHAYESWFSEEFLAEEIIHKTVRTEKGKMLLSGRRIPGLPVVILRMTSFGTAGTPYRILIVLLIMMVFFMLIVLSVGTYITKRFTRPVYELSARMDHNKRSGELKKIDMELPYSELNMLESDYNDMIDHVNDLIGTVIDKEKTLQRAEMRVLQEQIKPHFLYNTIETIGCLALDGGAENVYDALETMGSFYRNFLSKGEREIRLKQEVRIVQDYLSLQKLRYGDVLEDTYDISDKAAAFVVPKLILQPLVENCIYHGIRLKGEKGLIRISAEVEENVLHLTVRDTGVGMTKEQIEQVLSPAAEQDSSERSSFGLWGTIQRIRIFCGRDDVVSIESEPGEYTEIRLRITRGGV
ncbi:MAG: sensor histidine kinase [Lachnospiraceae bacterium]|nr:sensor histidine kinase [Lachnospiraceae bacterium]